MAALNYKYAECKDTGWPLRPPHNDIYGYLHRVRLYRRLRDETKRNIIEVMWLMDGLLPDDKTISNFRKDNSEEGTNVPNAEAIKAALEKLRHRQIKFEMLHERAVKEGEVSTIDPDSRLVRSGGDARNLDVGYNVQTIVDAKNHMIIDFDIAERSQVIILPIKAP